jgi:hypothetical protein
MVLNFEVHGQGYKATVDGTDAMTSVGGLKLIKRSLWKVYAPITAARAQLLSNEAIEISPTGQNSNLLGLRELAFQ